MLLNKGLYMSSTEWLCWKITKCFNTENCPARERENIPCWELARELDDYRTVLNVCEDCLVYLSRHKNSVLSEAEIQDIMEKKGVCILKERCARFVTVE